MTGKLSLNRMQLSVRRLPMNALAKAEAEEIPNVWREKKPDNERPKRAKNPDKNDETRDRSDEGWEGVERDKFWHESCTTSCIS